MKIRALKGRLGMSTRPLAVLTLAACFSSNVAWAEGRILAVAGGRIELTAPIDWKDIVEEDSDRYDFYVGFSDGVSKIGGWCQALAMPVQYPASISDQPSLNHIASLRQASNLTFTANDDVIAFSNDGLVGSARAVAVTFISTDKKPHRRVSIRQVYLADTSVTWAIQATCFASPEAEPPVFDAIAKFLDSMRPKSNR